MDTEQDDPYFLKVEETMTKPALGNIDSLNETNTSKK